MEGVDLTFFWGLLLGAGAMWILCRSGVLAPRKQSAADDDGEGPKTGEDEHGEASAKKEGVTVEGLAAALRHVSSGTDKVTVLRNRLSEIRGPLSGKDVITLLALVPSSTDRMEALRLLMPRVRGTVADNDYARIMSMLSSGDAAEASELLRR